MTRREYRAVVVGGGFAGASFLRNLPRSLRRPGEALLIDRQDSYPFIPLIHEVAAGRVHPGSISADIASLCRNRCEFLRTEVTGIDLSEKTLRTTSDEIGYEYLILTPGSGAALPPENLREDFQLFWTLDDALQLRASLAEAWGSAIDPGGFPAPGTLTVSIVGGGATGVELAAEIASLFGYLRKRTRGMMRATPRVVLLEARGHLIGWLDSYFHEVAMEELEKLGVEVWLNTPVQEADENGLRAGNEWIPSRVKVWAGGLNLFSLITELPVDRDESGRIRIDDHLTIPGHPEVYVLGDSGVYEDPRHGSLPPTASVAVQQGPYVARDLGRRLRGASEDERPPFDFFDRGYLVSLGPESAVGEAVGNRIRGPAAQALYRSIFLYYMRSRERALTSADWATERTLGRVGFDAALERRRARRHFG